MLYIYICVCVCVWWYGCACMCCTSEKRKFEGNLWLKIISIETSQKKKVYFEFGQGKPAMKQSGGIFFFAGVIF